MGTDDPRWGSYELFFLPELKDPKNPTIEELLAGIPLGLVTDEPKPPTLRQKFRLWLDDWKSRLEYAWRALKGEDFGYDDWAV